jgi:hypothetical protein
VFPATSAYKRNPEQEGVMTEPEERTQAEEPSEERVEEQVETEKVRPAAPIDEDMAGSLNAALPEQESN